MSGYASIESMCTVVTSELTIRTPEQMHAFGVALGRVLRPGDLVLLTGELGAGKTTLTRGIGAGMGVRGTVSSPTFVLARTHPPLQNGATLVHVDAYRLADSGELDDLDIDFANSVVVAEWGAGLVDSQEVALEIILTRPVGGGDAAAADFDAEQASVAERLVHINAYAPHLQCFDFQGFDTALHLNVQGKTER